MIFARRGGRGTDPLLQAKVQIFLAGAALALVGIGVDSSLLVGIAILVLLAGLILRFLAGRESASDDGVPDGEEDPQREENDVDLQGGPRGG